MPQTPSIRWFARRFGQLTGAQTGLLLEAAAFLLLARTALALVPVRYVLGWKRALVRGREAGRVGSRKGVAEPVAWAVLAIARRAPVAFVCFPQCLAAAAMLHRRGIVSRLHYGVTRQDGRIKTHTWLAVEEQILIGGEVAPDYAELAVY